MTNCAYSLCNKQQGYQFQVTEFLGAHRTITKHYCSLTHLLLGIMEEAGTESGSNLKRAYTMTSSMVRKFTSAIEKEWKATESKVRKSA